MELPDGEMLIITIDREVERECDCIETITGESPITGQSYDVATMPAKDCPTCHGTGQRKVRLRGFVPILLWYSYSTCGPDFGLSVSGVVGDRSNTYEGAVQNLANNIITAYRDGTLPPEIAANLEECDETK